MRKPIIELINQEIRNKRKGLPAGIKVKINHITDPKIIQRLYAAAQAGVDVQLLVRGNCCLVPGVKDVSEGIRANAIIDRYLEHARILYFCNNGQPKVYMGSADWMERNLDRRIEVMCPIFDQQLQAELIRTIDYGLEDVSQGHYVNEHEGQPRRLEASQPWFRSQAELYQAYCHQAETEMPNEQ
jgi:polyphosphate kinase